MTSHEIPDEVPKCQSGDFPREIGDQEVFPEVSGTRRLEARTTRRELMYSVFGLVCAFLRAILSARSAARFPMVSLP